MPKAVHAGCIKLGSYCHDGENNEQRTKAQAMARSKEPLTIRNDMQLLVFMRLWTSQGRVALEAASSLVSRSEGRRIEIPEKQGRDIKAEITQMHKHLSSLLDRVV